MSGLLPPSALVSWSHSSPDWTPAQVVKRQACVAAFVDLLRQRGIDADADLFHLSESVDWTRWGPQRIAEVDRVLIVVSDGWRLAWEGTGDPSVGSGAAAEADTLLSIYTGNRAEFFRKVRLVVFPDAAVDEIPKRLHGVPRFHLRAIDSPSLDEIVRDLTDQPAYLIKALGPVSVMPPVPTEPGSLSASKDNAALTTEKRELLATLTALLATKAGPERDQKWSELIESVNDRLREIGREEVTPHEWSRRQEHWQHADRLIAELDTELKQLEGASKDNGSTKSNFDKLAQSSWQTYLWFEFHLGILVTESTRKESEEDNFDNFVHSTLKSIPRYAAAYKPTRDLLINLLRSDMQPGNSSLIEQTALFRSGVTEVVDAVVTTVQKKFPPPRPEDLNS